MASAAWVTKHTAWRFHSEGIRCNAILPGAVDTNIQNSMVKENFDQESYSQLA
jgi:NAD(P)-dependent dehydrogenase (short-subunit alcohol dehydrogenase family)